MFYLIAILSFVAISFVLYATGVDAQSISEVQQQLDSVQKTVDVVNQQAQSVSEKGLFQTIWDNTVGAFFSQLAAIWQQIAGIFNQVISIFGLKA
jgi:hypothetical protein